MTVWIHSSHNYLKSVTKIRTPLIDVLLELLAWLQKQIDRLEQEILKLKGETTVPALYQVGG
jgi:hypothetical protein